MAKRIDTAKIGVDLWNLFQAVPAEIDPNASGAFAERLIEVLQTIRNNGASLPATIELALRIVAERREGEKGK